LPWISLAKRHGFCLKIIPLLADGRLDLSKLSTIIGPRCRLVAVTHVSNVTGAVSDLTTLVKAAHTLGAQVLVDGAQAVAHGPIDVPELGVDYYVFSGHKCYGPTGIGVIWGKLEALNKLNPFFTGGGMVQRLDLTTLSMTLAKGTSRFEAGTPPIAQAVGLGAALQWLSHLPWAFIKQQQELMCQHLLDYLTHQDQISLLGPLDNEARQPIITFAHAQHHAHDIGHLLDQYGIATRDGNHCAQPLMQHFAVMASTRVSLGVFNTMADIEHLTHGLQQAIATLES
jgi:cysteine desulfurase/selenocysteine lyase